MPTSPVISRHPNAALISEANDANGAARDALNRARTAAERRLIAEELNWWQGRLAHVTQVTS